MTQKDIEAKIHELIVKQGEYFKKKKADRKVAEIEAIRQEMNTLKAQAKSSYYRPEKKGK